MHDLEIDAVRVTLGQDVIGALDAHGIARDLQRELLGLSRDEWVRVQKEAPLPLEFEVLERVEHLLALARDCPPGWFVTPPEAGRAAPLTRMLTHGIAAMEQLRIELGATFE